MTATSNWSPPEDFDAMATLVACLVHKAADEPYDENEFLYAVMLVSTRSLVNKGLDVDTAITAVESAMQSGNIHLSYSDADGLSLIIGEEADVPAEPNQP